HTAGLRIGGINKTCNGVVGNDGAGPKANLHAVLRDEVYRPGASDDVIVHIANQVVPVYGDAVLLEIEHRAAADLEVLDRVGIGKTVDGITMLDAIDRRL